MTIASTTSRNTYTLNGATVVYPYSYRILKAQDIQVVVANAITGVESELTYGVGYTVSGVGNTSGGSITLASAGTSGDTLVIRRRRALLQDTVLSSQGAYFAQDTETALDGLLTIDQQQQEQIDRALTLPVSVDPATVSAVMPTPRANAVLVWNSTGTGIENRTLDASTNVVLPGGGRTVSTLTAYLSNNAIANVKDFGAVGEGVTNDTAAIQACIDYCFGTTASPHGSANAKLNKALYFPAGTYRITSALTFPKVVGARIFGDGRVATTITTATANTPIFSTNGFAYSTVEGLYFNNAAANTGAVIELDWDGSAGGLALQSNTFRDCYFGGSSLAAIGVRIGNAGFMGSENLFLNCFWGGCTTAGLDIRNFNALQNSIVGGNFQDCTLYGIRVNAGSVNVYSVGFQNAGVNGAQITNGGYDIAIVNSANDMSSVRSCRSESFKFLSSTNGHTVICEANNVLPSVTTWTASTALALGVLVTGSVANSDGKLYRVTTAGTTGGAEPTWTGAGTVASGSVVLTYVGYTVVSAAQPISLRQNILPYGTVSTPSSGNYYSGEIVGNTFTRSDWLDTGVYASGGSFIKLDGNVVLTGGIGPNSATGVRSYSAQPASGPALPWSATRQFNLGAMPLLFSSGAGGTMWGDVGFVRGSGSNATAAGTTPPAGPLNTLGLIGTLASPVPTAANTAGTDTIISGGQGTGTGISGKLRLRATPAGSAGSTANTPVDIAVIDEAGLALARVGDGFKVKEGSNATMGLATLVAGAVTVATTKVTATSRIFLMGNSDGGTPGWHRISARVAATSFTITSSSGTDTSTVAWLIVEPS